MTIFKGSKFSDQFKNELKQFLLQNYDEETDVFEESYSDELVSNIESHAMAYTEIEDDIPVYDYRDITSAFSEDDSFSRELIRLVDEKNLTDPVVYKRIFMDRRLFFKIKSNPDYQPSKETAVRLSIGLHLTYEETQEFIAKAGYTLTHSKKFDVIIEYCMKTNNYDIMKINDVLDDYGIAPLL